MPYEESVILTNPGSVLRANTGGNLEGFLGELLEQLLKDFGNNPETFLEGFG